MSSSSDSIFSPTVCSPVFLVLPNYLSQHLQSHPTFPVDPHTGSSDAALLLSTDGGLSSTQLTIVRGGIKRRLKAGRPTLGGSQRMEEGRDWRLGQIGELLSPELSLQGPAERRRGNPGEGTAGRGGEAGPAALPAAPGEKEAGGDGGPGGAGRLEGANRLELTQLLPHGPVASDEALAQGRAHLGRLRRAEALLLLDEAPQVLPGELGRLPPAVPVAHGEEGHGAARAPAGAGAGAGRQRSLLRRPGAPSPPPAALGGGLGAARASGRRSAFVRGAALRLGLHHDLGHVLHVFPAALVGEHAHPQRVQPLHGGVGRGGSARRRPPLPARDGSPPAAADYC